MKKLDLSMLGGDDGPDPNDPHSRHWDDLTSEEKIERLNVRLLAKEQRDRKFGGWIKLALGTAVTTAVLAGVNAIASGYRITSVPPAPIPTNSAERMGSDTVPRPMPARP